MNQHISLRTQESIEKIAGNLMKETQAVMVTVVSRHALRIASTGHPAINNEALDATIAMLAIAFGAAETAEANAERLPPNYLAIDGEKEYTLVIGAGSKALLIFRTQWWSDTDLKQIQKAADEIKKLLG